MLQKISSYISFVFLVGFLSSCSALKKSTNDNTARTQSNPRFINGIEITPGMSTTQIRHLEREAKRTEKLEAQQAKVNTSVYAGTETATALQLKYCTILDVPVETISGDSDLLQEVDEWWGTPYRMGGNTKSGIDCSAFSQIFMQDIFTTSIPRTAQQQYDNCTLSNNDEPLKKGDLVFFGSSKRNISHVGVYITNNKFVHASTSRGVMISDLNDNYWGKRYVGSGRYKVDTSAQN